jgi:hypothetical protein
MKIIVFDVDETLGAFFEFSLYCNRAIGNKKLTFQMFEFLLDINQIYLQPNILTVLEYIKCKKDKTCKVVMFTNNQGDPSWVNFIKRYFHKKLNFPLFDHVIYANKYELYRTSDQKSLTDFWACTKYPTHSTLLFIDDQFHPLMVNPKVTYLKLNPYKTDTYVDISEFLIQQITVFLK